MPIIKTFLINFSEIAFTEVANFYETLNSLAEKKELKSKLEELKFDNVIDNFGSEVFKIIDDIINLFSEKVDTFTEEKTTLDKYTSYIYRLIVILTKENRILYTGFIFIIIGFFIYFISDENKNYNVQYHNPSFLNRIL